MKGDLKKWKTMSFDEKKSVLPKLSLQCHKNPNRVFLYLDKLILMFMWGKNSEGN